MWTKIFAAYVTDRDAIVVHGYLLTLSVVATIACVRGILWEVSGPLNIHEFARKLVIWGVAIEALCTITLFVFDEGISAAQSSQINGLNADVAAAATREKDNAITANNALQENLRLEAKLADREVSADQRAIIKRLRGEGQEITVVVSSLREPQVYGYLGKDSIANALHAAGFKVVMDFVTHYVPPETGVVFCEVQDGDRRIYDVLHAAHVATEFLGRKDKRPYFCVKPGIEVFFERALAGATLTEVTPDTVGGRLVEGVLAPRHGARIYVGQKPE